MGSSRTSRARTNIIVSFLCQVLTLICGFIVPRLYIRTYGSEAYGAISSITQFLAYITLLEGGVAGVARAALYKPLSERNYATVGIILGEIKDYFRRIGIICIGYVLILACSFKSISNIVVLDWFSCFLLVLSISISTFAQYFIGITYAVFLQANQQQYISYVINIVTMALNTVMIVILIYLGFDIISVRLISSCIFVLRPVSMWLYVRRHYPIRIERNTGKSLLTQKWTAFAQHIAYFLHSNTDIAVLTIFGNLTFVAIYSVYHMITASVQNLANSFSAGMEAVFGDMIAKEEYVSLKRAFSKYETMISVISNVLLGTTSVMILPFIRLYTAGVQDAEYIIPAFAILLVLASFVFCLRLPYHAVVTAAGHFKQTRVAAYGEAIINIISSVLLVIRYGIIGVALGTVVAISFRFLFYVYYLRHNILQREYRFFFWRCIINLSSFVLIYSIGCFAISRVYIVSYLQWLVMGFFVLLLSCCITILANCLFYREDMLALFSRLLK